MSYEKLFFREFVRVFRDDRTPQCSGLAFVTSRLRSLGVLSFATGTDRKMWQAFVQKFILVAFLFIDTAMIVSLSSSDGITRTLTLGEICACSLIGFKVQHFQRNSAQIISLSKELDEFFVESVRNLNSGMKSRIRFIFMEFYVVCNLAGYVLTAFLVTSAVVITSLTTNEVPFPAKYPWDIYGSDFSFYGTFALQALAYSFEISAIAFMDAFGIGTIHYMNMFFEIHADKMRRLQTDRESMRKLVVEHQYILDLTERINALFQPLFIVQIVGSLCMFCVSGFQMVVSLIQGHHVVVLKFMVYVMASFIQIAVWCYNGNKIYWTSKDMHQAFLECDWLEMPQNVKKDFVFVIQNFQKPVEFRAGHLCSYNFDTLIWILNKSYSVFAVLMKTLQK